MWSCVEGTSSIFTHGYERPPRMESSSNSQTWIAFDRRNEAIACITASRDFEPRAGHCAQLCSAEAPESLLRFYASTIPVLRCCGHKISSRGFLSDTRSIIVAKNGIACKRCLHRTSGMEGNEGFLQPVSFGVALIAPEAHSKSVLEYLLLSHAVPKRCFAVTCPGRVFGETSLRSRPFLPAIRGSNVGAVPHDHVLSSPPALDHGALGVLCISAHAPLAALRKSGDEIISIVAL
jgi:hypothetical protein